MEGLCKLAIVTRAMNNNGFKISWFLAESLNSLNLKYIQGGPELLCAIMMSKSSKMLPTLSSPIFLALHP